MENLKKYYNSLADLETAINSEVKPLYDGEYQRVINNDIVYCIYRLNSKCYELSVYTYKSIK